MDADIHLEQILTQAQRRIRLIDMAIGGMVMVIFTFGFFFSEVLLDHFIILRRPYRLGLLVLYQVASIGLVLWLVLRPVFRRINQLFIAHRIEHQHPELKNRLVTYLQLDNETSPIIRHDISNNISRKLEGFAVPSVFSFKVLKPFAAAFIALSLLIYGYALLSQKSITVSLKRAIFPTQQILPPTLTKISRVEPGDADVLKGNPVEFWAQTEGNSPETADLVYSMDDGTTWETMPMTVSGNGILKASMEAPEDTIRYFLAAGDTRSERYVVTVVNPPTLTSIRGELFFPAYTGLEKREFQGGTVKAIEGSRATIQGETNVPVNQAQVMLGNSKDSTIVRITTPQRITFDVAVHSNDIYRVLLTSTQGYKELNPPRHRIIALKDKPPEVRAIQPAQDVELAENESLELVFRMRDDFGLTSVKLRLKSRFEEERILPLVVPDLTREKTANVRLPVKSLGLRAGDEATYSILVQDNKPDEPNAGESQTFGLRILDSRPVQLALNAPEESDTTVETDQTEQEASEEQGEQSSDEERAERDNSQADSESPANSAASTPDAEDSNEADSSEDAGDGDRDEGASQTDEEDEQQRAGDNEQSDSDSTEGQNSETDTAGDGSTEQNAEQSQSGTNSEDSQDGSTDAEGAQPAAGQEPEANRTQSNDQNSGTQPSDSQQGEASDTATSRASDSSQDSGTDSQPGQQAGAEEGTQPGQQQGEQTGSQPGQQAVSQPGQQQGEQTGSQPGQQQGEQPGSQSGQQAGSQPGSQPGQQAGSQPGSQPGQQAGSQPGSQSGQQAGSQPGQQAGSQPGSQPGQQAGSQPGSQPGQQAGSQPGSQPGQQAGSQPGSQPGQQSGENSQPGSTPSGSQPGQGEGSGASGQGSQPGSSQSGQSAGAQPGGQGSQPGSSQGQGAQSQAGQGAGSQGEGQNSQSGSQGSGSQAGGQSGSSQSGAQSGSQNSQGQGSSGQQASSSGQGSQGGSSTGSGSSSQGGNGGSGSPQAGNGSTSQPIQGEAQIARSSQAGAGRNAGEDKGSANPEINPNVFRQGGDGLPLKISSGGEDHLRDLKDFAALDENRLVELGFSKAAARQFARKLQELKLKERKGQKDEELEKDLLEMAQSIALAKQKILKSEGVAGDVSGSSVKAEYKTDESAVVEAQLRNLPPQYREMVEEYFRSISSRKQDGEN